MGIELGGVQFGLKSFVWFHNQKSAQRGFDLKLHVWPKLHDTKFNNHFITSILKSKNSITQYNFFSLYKYLTDLVYWAGLRKISKGFSHICTNWLISLDKP